MDAELFEAKPEVMGGKLCFRGTRLPLETILSVIEAGWSDETILAQFPVLTAVGLAAARRLASALDSGWEEHQVP